MKPKVEYFLIHGDRAYIVHEGAAGPDGKEERWWCERDGRCVVRCDDVGNDLPSVTRLVVLLAGAYVVSDPENPCPGDTKEGSVKVVMRRMQKKPPPYSYTIQINEGQRQLLMRMLHTGDASILSKDDGTGCGAYDTENDEFIALEEMLGALPDAERENPGVVHGFCF